jgi:hypothetical protein
LIKELFDAEVDGSLVFGITLKKVLTNPLFVGSLFVGLAYQGKDIVVFILLCLDSL